MLSERIAAPRKARALMGGESGALSTIRFRREKEEIYEECLE
jgi:hypothetical protein